MTTIDRAPRYYFRFLSCGQGRADFAVNDRATRETRRLHLFADHTARLQTEPLPADMLDAFNFWRADQHAADMAWIAQHIDPAICADYPFTHATHAR